MRLKSRGLGRKELVMDFREYELVHEGDEVVVIGTIRDPVNWDFSIRVCEDDFAGLLHIGFRRSMLGILLRSLFRRKRRHHWNQERAEHLAEGARRLPVAQQKACEHERAYRVEQEAKRAKGALGAGESKPRDETVSAKAARRSAAR